ncbi:MAG: cyclic nucleotide-binding domain-containing protein [Acidobacteriota bacterium]
MDMLTTLKDTELFAALTDEELTEVVNVVVQREVEAGAVLVEEGRPGEALFLVHEGKVKVEKTSGGDTITLAELGAGAAVGEMSLLDDSPTSARVSAVEPTTVLSISRLDLDVLLNWNTVLAAKMWRSFTKVLSQRVRDMNDRVLAKYGADALSD